MNVAMGRWEVQHNGAAANNRNLYLRVLSALVLVPVALALAWAGGAVFALGVAAIAILAYREWLRMAGSRADATWTALGIAYVVIPSAGLIAIRAGNDGFLAILLVFLVVWATDTAAYVGGRVIGGPRLWPAVSPKKTWAGAITGFMAALATGGLVAVLAASPATLSWIVVAGILSVAAQCGDLLESAVKRRFGVKDSGTLIPGHGGVLDRIDGLYGASAASLVLLVAGIGFPLASRSV